MKHTNYIYKFSCFLIAITVPQLIFYGVKESTGFTGAPAITHTLKLLGFNLHMEIGIKSLLVIGVLSFMLSEWSIIQYYRAKIEKDIAHKKISNLLNTMDLIDNYNIPTLLKRKLKTYYL